MSNCSFLTTFLLVFSYQSVSVMSLFVCYFSPSLTLPFCFLSLSPPSLSFSVSLWICPPISLYICHCLPLSHFFLCSSAISQSNCLSACAFSWLSFLSLSLSTFHLTPCLSDLCSFVSVSWLITFSFPVSPGVSLSLCFSLCVGLFATVSLNVCVPVCFSVSLSLPLFQAHCF